MLPSLSPRQCLSMQYGSGRLVGYPSRPFGQLVVLSSIAPAAADLAGTNARDADDRGLWLAGSFADPILVNRPLAGWLSDSTSGRKAGNEDASRHPPSERIAPGRARSNSMSPRVGGFSFLSLVPRAPVCLSGCVSSCLRASTANRRTPGLDPPAWIEGLRAETSADQRRWVDASVWQLLGTTRKNPLKNEASQPASQEGRKGLACFDGKSTSRKERRVGRVEMS